MRRLAVALSLAGCALSPAPASPAVTQAAWDEARGRLEALRARFFERPYVERLRVSLREPRTHRVFEARGAVAVQPGTAARMVLIGPAGATALDMWLGRDGWRFHVPALGPARRGGRDDSPAELPVGFFRWWLLAPLSGRLLTVTERGELVLRDGGATVRIGARAFGPHLEMRATRTVGARGERLFLVGLAARPAAGDVARYVDQRSGLSVDVTVEGVSPLDDLAALLDPDAGGVSL